MKESAEILRMMRSSPPVQRAADGCLGNLTQVSRCQSNKATFLVTDRDAIPAGQAAAVETSLWRRAASLKTMEELPLSLCRHGAAEGQVAHTASILLTENRSDFNAQHSFHSPIKLNPPQK